ncbi:MAG: Holliday junction resolvase RuvX [Clostridia bacterium]|jgi:putative Holliday junction resolvase|nr:Holliday junction resolvase RuvX [Clostridia bacterium]
MRIIGLDIGEKRIGMALSDELGLTAQGLETFYRTSLDKDISGIRTILAQHGAQKIVAGLPRNMNGTYGPQAEKIREFATQLGQQSGLEVTYWDERLTSAAAERTLLEANVSRGKRKKVVDKLAAVLILQGYLDAQNR